MRRNMDLIRWILIEVEANDDPNEYATPVVEGFSEVEVCHHIALMAQAGLISAVDRSAIGVYFWSAGQLTFHGHELLECARDEALWNEVTRHVADACGGTIFEVIRDTLLERQRARAAGSG